MAADPEHTPRRRRRSLLPLLIVLALGGAAVAVAPRLLKKPPLVVRVVRVERAIVRDQVASASAGEVEPALRAVVRAELGARVLRVYHRRGERVRKGEVVVLLDSSDVDARVAQAEAAVAAQAAALAQARVRLSTVEKQAARARTLAERGAGTQQLAEDAAQTVTEVGEALRVADAGRLQAQAAVRVAKVAQQKSQLTAPFDGLLVDVLPDQGEQLAPGAPVFELIDDRSLHVEATIDEADVPKVRVGQPARLKIDALPEPLVGRVSLLAPAVRRDLKGARVLPLEVEVVEPAAAVAKGLRPGMSVNLEIDVAEKRDVPSLPSSAVMGRGVKRTVYRIESGVARLRTVELGLVNWERSEIASGLEVGDEVVASLNQKGLEEGVAVTVEGSARTETPGARTAKP